LLCINNPISRVTFPFPPGVSSMLMQVVFAGTHLVPSDTENPDLNYLPNETLAEYEARLTQRNALAAVAVAGTSRADDALKYVPPRVTHGTPLPGGPGYTETAAQYDNGKAKFGGRTYRRRRPHARTRTRTRTRTRGRGRTRRLGK
jgi:hypothetical protein